jgi:hypothetical protein
MTVADSDSAMMRLNTTTTTMQMTTTGGKARLGCFRMG